MRGCCDELKQSIEKVWYKGESCERSGHSLPSQKIPLKHINHEFNDEMKIEFFTFIRIFNEIFTVMHMVDMGTAFYETDIV